MSAKKISTAGLRESGELLLPSSSSLEELERLHSQQLRLQASGATVHEQLRRLSYLLQIARLQLSGEVSSRPYHRSTSYRLGPAELRRRELIQRSQLPSARSSRQPKVRSETVVREAAPAREIYSQRQIQPRTKVSHSQSFLFSVAWQYIRLFLKVSTAVFLTINCLYIGFAITFGNPYKLPKAYVGMSQSIYQGFHCGWHRPTPDDWTKCYE